MYGRGARLPKIGAYDAIVADEALSRRHGGLEAGVNSAADAGFAVTASPPGRQTYRRLAAPDRTNLANRAD